MTSRKIPGNNLESTRSFLLFQNRVSVMPCFSEPYRMPALVSVGRKSVSISWLPLINTSSKPFIVLSGDYNDNNYFPSLLPSLLPEQGL
jgi:hypothetical protein